MWSTPAAVVPLGGLENLGQELEHCLAALAPVLAIVKRNGKRGFVVPKRWIELASALQTFLATRGVCTTIRTAVVVINDRASLGVCDDCPVDVVSIGTHYLLDSIQAQGPVFDAGTHHKIAALIRRDHTFHAQRRGSRRR